MTEFTLIAKTLFNLEGVLFEELKELGAKEIEKLNRAVKYKGDQSLLYKSNLHLRTALKILKPIDNFEVHNESQLYKKIKRIPWDTYFDVDQTFAIDATTSGDRFRHSKFAALKSKDAIVDQFREKYGKRPSVNTNDPDLRINIHISNTSCTVSLDSSGLSLDRRGYRIEKTDAPINEVLAAGMILLSGWDKKSDFFDPMCGSGTIPIEAALMASNTPPGYQRNFAFMKWKAFDKKNWEDLKNDAQSNISKPVAKIYGSDKDLKAFSVALSNAKRAGVSKFVSFKREDFFQTKAPSDSGLIMINPPYGERMGQEKIIQFYQDTGSHLKHHYEGWQAWIISANQEALKNIGLKTSKRFRLYNGPLDCKFYGYDLYKGSRKRL